jgi:intein/homing endonuclease
MSEEKLLKTIERLREIRAKEDLNPPPSKILRSHLPNGVELKLRQYQIQGILHLIAMPRFVLGDDTGLGKCVTGDTLISTDKGLLPIASLNPGVSEPDTFVPFDGDAQVVVRGETRRIRSFYYGGLKPTVKIRTRRGYEIEGSHIHPLLVRGEDGSEDWVKMSDLKEGDTLCLNRSSYVSECHTVKLVQIPQGQPGEKKYRVPQVLDSRLARLFGYLVSEGWFNHDYHFNVAQCLEKNPEVCRDIEDCFTALSDYKPRYADGVYSISSSYLIRFLEAQGLTKGVAKDKAVPFCVLRANPSLQAEFLKALFEAEGHVSQETIEISSASSTLLKQVQTMLLSFGVLSTRREKYVKGYDHTYWRLTITGADTKCFMSQIGMVSSRKIEALKNICSKIGGNTNLDTVPHTKELFERYRLKVAHPTKHGNSFVGTLGHIRAERRNPSYDFIRKCVRDIHVDGELQDILANNYFYDPIVEVTYGEAEVFDIEVDHPEHSFVGNGFVCHNTLQSIAALSYIWDKNPSIPALICTTKSAVGQWESEFDKFTHGVKVFKCLGTKKKREKIHNEFNLAEGPKVIIMGYRTAVQDFQYIQHMVGHVVIFDEATAFKNDTSQVHQVCKHMAGSAERVWSLSATIIKNRLMEAWAIYKVTVPHLFGAKTHFMREYCITRDQTIPGSRRRIQIVVGHRKRDIQAFREHIDAYFLGRPKHEVAQELPPLTTKIIECELSKAQKNKYAEALQGLLEYLDPETGELAEREVSKLTAVTVCQQIVNHPALVDCEGDSGKLDTLLDLVTNELEGEKVIVFSRFRGMVDILEAELNGKGIQTCRITGAESGDERLASQKAFQDPESETKVCLITMAAAEGVNLQLAKAVIFYDTPWSAGDYLQIVGRMIRIGSIHDKVFSYHICAPKTIDDRVMKTLKAKMGLIEAVLGKRLKEDGESDAIVEVGQSELADIFDGLLEDAQEIIKVK